MGFRDLSDDNDELRALSQHDEDAGYPYTYPITYDSEVDVRNAKAMGSQTFPWEFPLWWSDAEPRNLSNPGG